MTRGEKYGSLLYRISANWYEHNRIVMGEHSEFLPDNKERSRKAAERLLRLDKYLNERAERNGVKIVC